MNPSQRVRLSEAAERILSLSAECAGSDEVPVASMIFQTQSDPLTIVRKILSDDAPLLVPLATGQNGILGHRDPTAHAEILAIRKACNATGSERLTQSLMVTTLEPCVMCAGALILARIDLVIYLLPALKGVGMKTVIEQNRIGMNRFNHYPLLIHDQRFEEAAAKILRDFFRKRRSERDGRG